MNNFIKHITWRAVRTMCQCAVSLIPASALISEVDWRLVASASVLSGIVSVLTSIATGLPETDLEKAMHMNKDEPDDAEIGIEDDEVEEEAEDEEEE